VVVGTVDEKDVDPLKKNEPLMLTVGTATTVGLSMSFDQIGFELN